MSDIELVEKLSRRRARVLTVLAIYFMVAQGAMIGRTTGAEPGRSLRTVDAVHISAWFALAIALLVLLLTGGAFFRSASVRALLNDENTRANRQRALALGFGNAMATCIMMYVVSMFEPLSGRDTIHIVMTVGIGSALIAFAALERRALRDG